MAPISYGPLRRREGPAYLALVLSNLGSFDHLLQMETRAPREMGRAFTGGTWTLLRLLSLLGRSPVTFLAARDGTRIVGSTVLAQLPACGYIGAVGTERSYRRQGIATRLMELAEKETQKRGRRWSALDVEAGNAEASGLYGRRGYRTVLRTAWFLRDSPEPLPPGPTSEVSLVPLPPAGFESARAWCRSNQPDAVRGPMDPGRRMFSSLELTSFSPWMPNETWQARRAGKTFAYLRAFRSPTNEPSFLFVPAASPEATAADLRTVLARGEDWLRAGGAHRMLVPQPENLPALAGALGQASFERKEETWTMVKSLT